MVWRALAAACAVLLAVGLSCSAEPQRTLRQLLPAERWARPVRSQTGATTSEQLLNMLNQRLDMVQTERLALREELQLARTRNENLREAVYQLRDYMLMTTTTTTTTQATTTTTAAATTPIPTTPTTPEHPLPQTTATTAHLSHHLIGHHSSTAHTLPTTTVDYFALLPAIHNEAKQLKVKVGDHDVTMAFLLQAYREIEQNYSKSWTPLNVKVMVTNMKYNMVDEIVRGLQRDSQAHQRLVANLLGQSSSLLLQANRMQRSGEIVYQNSLHYIEDVARTIRILLSGVARSPQVAFQATAEASEAVLQSGSAIVFPNVVMNEGNLYNRTTGHVSTSYAGWYLFLVQLAIRINNFNDVEILLMKNDQTLAALSKDQAVSSDKHLMFANLHAIVHLGIHDRVWVKVIVPHTDPHHPDHIISAYASTFLGVMLTQ